MARLSWGRSSVERPRSRWRPILIGAAVIVGAVASVDGFVHRSIITGDAPAAIQALLDQHLRTLERRDQFQYQRTLDRRSTAHTRCMDDRYADGILRMTSALRPNRLVGLEEAAPESTLVRAYVERRDGIATEYVRRAQLVNILTLPPFDIRRVSDIWYLGSPTDEELGGHVVRTTARAVAIESRDIDEPARDAIQRELAVMADEFAVPPVEAPTATSPPSPPILRVRVLPAPEFGPTGCVNGARYLPERGEIVIHPAWADTERSALSEATRAQLRDAYKEWDRLRKRPPPPGGRAGG